MCLKTFQFCSSLSHYPQQQDIFLSWENIKVKRDVSFMYLKIENMYENICNII